MPERDDTVGLVGETFAPMVSASKPDDEENHGEPGSGDAGNAGDVGYFAAPENQKEPEKSEDAPLVGSWRTPVVSASKPDEENHGEPGSGDAGNAGDVGHIGYPAEEETAGKSEAPAVHPAALDVHAEGVDPYADGTHLYGGPHK